MTEIIRANAQEESLQRKERGELDPIAHCYVDANCAESLLRNQGDAGGGLTSVVVVRTPAYDRYQLCTYLVDYWCLGLKDTIGIKKFNSLEYSNFLETIYVPYNGNYVEISLDQAQSIVWGAIEYAQSLGLQPHRDFEGTKAHIGEWDGKSRLEFGRAGRPCYFQGPHDNVSKILKTLRQSVGEGNFDYVKML
ncbi:MAG: hypothetical protein N5P05_004378 (plasmid) [Chroococcopsis gigantea SAG 12.99]|nr:hypothetical protein [Chroococcopsis gigantea SAG 12.99]